MPLLAGFPVLTSPQELLHGSLIDTRTLALRSLDGADLMPFSGREFFLLSGIDGLEMPPREVVTEKVPGMDGTRLRRIDIGEREVFLPLFIGSDSSHLQYLDDRTRLRRLFSSQIDYRAAEGTFELVANSRDGQNERYLRCTYRDGWTGGYGTDDEGVDWASLGLKFVAVQPYWAGPRWTTPAIKAAEGVEWLGPFPGQLSSSRALGLGISVTVGGDVNSWVRVDLVGPATSITVSASGLLVSIPGGLAAGETASIETNPRGRVAIFNGVKDWTRIGPTTKWAPIAPGEQEIGVVVAGATIDTQAIVSGPSWFEMPW